MGLLHLPAATAYPEAAVTIKLMIAPEPARFSAYRPVNF